MICNGKALPFKLKNAIAGSGQEHILSVAHRGVISSKEDPASPAVSAEAIIVTAVEVI
jgi:hypothetical protein